VTLSGFIHRELADSDTAASGEIGVLSVLNDPSGSYQKLVDLPAGQILGCYGHGNTRL
jgi:hypothetical protein